MSQRQLTPADYLAMLRRRWVLIAVLTFVGGPLAYGVSKLLPNRYKSQTLVLVDAPTVPSDVVRPVVTADLNQRLASDGSPVTSFVAETRVWQRQDGLWKHVHFHRSV